VEDVAGILVRVSRRPPPVPFFMPTTRRCIRVGVPQQGEGVPQDRAAAWAGALHRWCHRLIGGAGRSARWVSLSSSAPVAPRGSVTSCGHVPDSEDVGCRGAADLGRRAVATADHAARAPSPRCDEGL